MIGAGEESHTISDKRRQDRKTTSRIEPVPQPRFSRSLEYGVAMLECFTAERPVLRISELADMVGISRATTHRYASTLVSLGRLEQDDKRRYRLARSAARPGTALIETIRLKYPARTVLEDLREQTGYTASMGMLDGSRALYIHSLHGHGAGQYEADRNISVGAYVSAQDTAIGKALLSCLLASELQSLFPAIQFGHVPDVNSDAQKTEAIEAELRLVTEIERAARDGIAVHEDVNGAGVLSIAAPATRWIDKPILAVAVSAPAARCTIDELIANAGILVSHAAKQISI